jgi:two-component system response regulator
VWRESSPGATSLHQRRRPYADATRPDIILLDLNLPRLEGREVLARIKSNPDLATIPTIVLTSSSAEIDIQESYELHANCFVSKPVDFTEFLEAVRSLEGFWLKIVRLP